MSPLSLLLSTAAATSRRSLRESDLSYSLSDFNRNFHTRAPRHFADDASFRRRLFEHDASLADAHPHVFVARLREGHAASPAARERLGTRTLSVLGDDLLVHATPDDAHTLRSRPEVVRVVPLLPELKVTPHFEALLPANVSHVSLNARLVLPAADEAEEAAQRAVSRVAAAHAARCAAAWAGRASCGGGAGGGGGGVAVRLESWRTLVVERLPANDALDFAHALADEHAVLWVEPHALYSPLNAEAAMITQSGSTPLGGGGTLVGTTPIWDMGLHGEGEVIGVGDSGLDTGHCFFEQAQGQTGAQQNPSANHRKVVAYRPYADNEATGTRDHGTHVVGSILGKSSAPAAPGATEKGTAYEAKVSFTDIGPGDSPGLSVPNDLVNNFFNVDYNNGARIHSNSWGANVNAYTLSAADVDEFMHKFDDMLILFAAGNSGPQLATIGSPATCKNCLSVGASENQAPPRQDGNVAYFSSQGPTVANNAADRIKPDVVAPGFSVTSANSNSAGDCPITEMAGTSMATPVTAGDVALIRQYLREGWYPTGAKNSANSYLPSGALLKAMVIQSAVALTGLHNNQPLGPTPSNVQGFGRVQLDRVLFPLAGTTTPDKRLLMVDGGTTGTIGATGVEKTFTVPTTGTDAVLGQQFKVTLVYTDPPAQPLASTPLVNNLDLKVVYTTTAGANATLWGNGINNGDPKNNVEQVSFSLANAEPSAKVWVTVIGKSVPQPPQKFAVVVTGPLVGLVDDPGTGGGDLIGGGASGGTGGGGESSGRSGDVVALSLSIPLLALAVAAGGCFAFRRRGSGGSLKGHASQKQMMLPAGWKKLSDPRSGYPYYMNEVTGATQWEVPAGAQVGAPPPPPLGAAPLPPNWIQATDPATGRVYYFNTATGTSSWTLP